MEKNCGICRYFDGYYCRRFPPKKGIFEITRKDQWCGEFKFTKEDMEKHLGVKKVFKLQRQ